MCFFNWKSVINKVDRRLIRYVLLLFLLSKSTSNILLQETINFKTTEYACAYLLERFNFFAYHWLTAPGK